MTERLLEDQIQEEQFQQPEQQQKRLIFQVDQGHRSKQTAYKYKMHFQRFLDYIRIQDLDVFLDLGRDAIQVLVMNYTKSLRDNVDKKYTRGTVNNLVCPIIYFLDNNDIELNKRMIRRYFPSDESVQDDRPYTFDEIRKILSVCDLRTRAMILLMVSTGMRIGALHSLRISDLTKIEHESSILYKVQVYARTRDRYFGFTTSECTSAIDDYLDYRRRCGEEVNDRSPLFRKHFNKGDPFTINVPYPLKEATIHKNIDEALRKAGVKTSECMRSHAWTKGWKSIAERSGMKSINVEILLGHNIGISGHYYRPNEFDLLQDFMQHAADALTIDPNQRLKARVQQLESQQAQEIERLKTQLQGYREEQARVQDTSRESLRELRRRLDATEDKHEKALLALEHARKTLIHYDEKHKQEKFVS